MVQSFLRSLVAAAVFAVGGLATGGTAQAATLGLTVVDPASPVISDTFVGVFVFPDGTVGYSGGGAGTVSSDPLAALLTTGSPFGTVSFLNVAAVPLPSLFLSGGILEDVVASTGMIELLYSDIGGTAAGDFGGFVIVTLSNALFDSNSLAGGVVPVSYPGSSLTAVGASVIPLPAPAFLLLSGFLALAVLRRRRDWHQQT